jgi:hypothetical protein
MENLELYVLYVGRLRRRCRRRHEGIGRAVAAAITLISSLMIMAQGGLVLVNFRFITGGITY